MSDNILLLDAEQFKKFISKLVKNFNKETTEILTSCRSRKDDERGYLASEERWTRMKNSFATYIDKEEDRYERIVYNTWNPSYEESETESI